MTENVAPACGNCGALLLPGVSFCTRCGQRLDQAGASSAADDSLRSSFASEAEVRQNQTYVGNRLMFTRNGDVEVSFANIVSGQLVWGHFKRVLITQVILWVIGSTALSLLSIVMAVRQTYSYAGPPGISGFVVFLGLVLLAISVALLVLAFSGWIQQPMSEWELLLDDRALRVDDAYASISAALQRRRTPARVAPEFIASDVVAGETRKYLIVRNDPYVVYVSVMVYGTGLYLAWSMWREQRVISLYAEWFNQLRNRWAGAGSLLHFLLRAEGARALRETVHNAVREGVETALAEQQRGPVATTGFAAPSVGGSAPRADNDFPLPPQPFAPGTPTFPSPPPRNGAGAGQ